MVHSPFSDMDLLYRWKHQSDNWLHLNDEMAGPSLQNICSGFSPTIFLRWIYLYARSLQNNKGPSKRKRRCIQKRNLPLCFWALRTLF